MRHVDVLLLAVFLVILAVIWCECEEQSTSKTVGSATAATGASTKHKLEEKRMRKQLSKMMEKIDTSNDDMVSKNELYQWTREVRRKKMLAETNQAFQELDKNDDALIDAEELARKKGEKLDDWSGRRFEWSDENGDAKLNEIEFLAYLAPHTFGRIRPLMAFRIMETIDTNGDNQLSEQEYMSEIEEEMKRAGDDTEQIPRLLDIEREKFLLRDVNRDGFLDIDEVKMWMESDDMDEKEVDRIFDRADDNKDDLIDQVEALSQLPLFVSSPVTDQGKLLTKPSKHRPHDEL